MRSELSGGTKGLAVLGAAGAVGFLLTLDTGHLGVRLTTKALPMLCLLLWLWPSRGRYARFIFAGLVLSLFGDVLLEMGPDLFLPGLGAFLLGHVSYTAAYLSVTRSLQPARALPFVLLAVVASGVLWPGLGNMAVPVTAYVAVICTMAWRAAAMMGGPGLPRREQWAALAGALMFAVSDGLIAIKLFVRPLPGSSYAIMLLYWAAQLCIASSTRGEHAESSSAFATSGAGSTGGQVSPRR